MCLKFRWLLLVGLLLSVPACMARPAGDTLLGAWRFDDGALITLAPSLDDTWRYRHLQDGRSGRLHSVDGGWQGGAGFSDRDPPALRVEREGDVLHWTPAGQSTVQARRVAVVERPLAWMSAGVTLRGQLILPPGPGPHPVVVLIHGSERSPAIGQWHDPYLLAAHGIAGFVYDKRSTGLSNGEFTADFRRLADDAASAAELLARQPEVDPDRIGFAGYSQGGWVAPLAAQRFGRAAAVLVGYGMVDSPFHEDRWQCMREARLAGASADDLQAVGRLVDATHRVLGSGLREGWSEFKSEVRQSRDRPWFRQLDADACIAAGFAAWPAWVIRTFAARRLPPQIDWDYDSHQVLTALQVPMLWLLAGDDSEAVVDDTDAAIRRLASAGKPFETIVLEGAEHGMVMYRTAPDGEAIPVGYHPEYFARTLAFWQERLQP